MNREAFAIVAGWFWDWLEYHQFIHRNDRWILKGHDTAAKYYRGWIETFVKNHVTKSEAEAATRRMQGSPSAIYPDRTPGIVVEHAREIRAEKKTAANTVRAGVNAAHLEAERASLDCPECSEPPLGGHPGRPTGWARRRWSSPQLPRPIMACLYCRCPLGQLRAAADVPSAPMFQAKATNLQAYPDLWDDSKKHGSWTVEPVKALSWPTPDGWWLPPSAPEPPTPEAPAPPNGQRRKPLPKPVPAVPLDGPPLAIDPGPPLTLTPMQADFVDLILTPEARAKFEAMNREKQKRILHILGPEPNDERISLARQIVNG